MLKGKKIAILLIIFGMVEISVSGCANNTPNIDSQQGILREDSTENDSINTDNSKMNPSDIDYVDASYTNEENIHSIKETVSMNGISYHILSFEKTKTFGNRNSDTLADYLEDKVDEDNNFVGNESYVFITMTITNETDETVEVYRCPGNVMSIDENMEVLQLGECIYMDEYWNGGDPSSVYAYSLKPGESVTSEFADMVNDNDVNVEGRKLYYEIKHSDDMDDSENIFIKLEE